MNTLSRARPLPIHNKKATALQKSYRKFRLNALDPVSCTNSRYDAEDIEDEIMMYFEYANQDMQIKQAEAIGKTIKGSELMLAIQLGRYHDLENPVKFRYENAVNGEITDVRLSIVPNSLTKEISSMAHPLIYTQIELPPAPGHFRLIAYYIDEKRENEPQLYRSNPVYISQDYFESRSPQFADRIGWRNYITTGIIDQESAEYRGRIDELVELQDQWHIKHGEDITGGESTLASWPREFRLYFAESYEVYQAKFLAEFLSQHMQWDMQYEQMINESINDPEQQQPQYSNGASQREIDEIPPHTTSNGDNHATTGEKDYTTKTIEALFDKLWLINSGIESQTSGRKEFTHAELKTLLADTKFYLNDIKRHLDEGSISRSNQQALELMIGTVTEKLISLYEVLTDSDSDDNDDGKSKR